MIIKKYPQTTTAYKVVFINTDTNEVEFEYKVSETFFYKRWLSIRLENNDDLKK